MKSSFSYFLIMTALFGLFQSSLYAQGGSKINVKFIAAKFLDTSSTKNLVCVFLVSTTDSASFPPIVNIPPKCSIFENGREKIILLGPHNLAVSFDGENIAEKNKVVYEIIKGKVNLQTLQTSMLVSYTIKDVVFYFKNMTLTPSFREKENQSIRIEKRFEFEVQ